MHSKATLQIDGTEKFREIPDPWRHPKHLELRHRKAKFNLRAIPGEPTKPEKYSSARTSFIQYIQGTWIIYKVTQQLLKNLGGHNPARVEHQFPFRLSASAQEQQEQPPHIKQSWKPADDREPSWGLGQSSSSPYSDSESSPQPRQPWHHDQLAMYQHFCLVEITKLFD